MKKLVEKYAAKLVEQGLSPAGEPLVGGLDAGLDWNREDSRCDTLAPVFSRLGINSLALARPEEPYRTIIDFLCSRHPQAICPRDCETRTFLHSIPVLNDFSTESVSKALGSAKAVIIPGHGIAATGTVTPEQCFVYISSVCFACFVLFFSEYLEATESGTVDPEFSAAFKHAVRLLPPEQSDPPHLAQGPFNDRETMYAAMDEAGSNVVHLGLVDSFFGNISCLEKNDVGDVVHISQTGSSLDELAGCIDPCPLDESSCAGLTASSELSAHMDIYARRNDVRCILHGHPKFTVTMSMHCTKKDCAMKQECHLCCPKKRYVAEVPVVPGEVGTGPTGLCHTLPPALETADAAIVHGHGLFAVSKLDFNSAFKLLLETENASRREYFRLIQEAG